MKTVGGGIASIAMSSPSRMRLLPSRMAALVPIAALLCVSLVWPILTIVARSLDEKGRATFPPSLYFGHYRELFADPFLWYVTQRTFSLAAISTAVTVAMAFPAAFVISRMPARMARLVLLLIVVPLWVSIIIRLFAFTAILGREGVINSIFSVFGLGPFSLLFNTGAALTGMVAYLLPYMVLILTSAMASVDSSLQTAAHTMGASGQQAFRQVYLPQLRPALVGGATLIFVMSLGFFLTPAILGGPRDVTIPIYIQQQVNLFAWGKASAAGIMLLVVSVAGYLLAFRIGGVHLLTPGRRSGSRGSSSRDEIRLTPATIACFGVLGLVFCVLLLPLVIVAFSAFGATSQIRFPPVGFTVSWFEQALTDPQWTAAILKSLRVGLATAVLSTCGALALARVGSQSKSQFGKVFIQGVAISPVIVPVILLAIGTFDVQGRIGLLGTELGLVIAHVTIALPLSFLIIANGLSNLDPALEQAAWTMGVSPARTFWTVVVPSINLALIGSALAAFATSWDEAVIALFQVGLEKTLPVTIYSFLKSGVTPVVAAIAVLMTVPIPVLFIAASIFNKRRQRSAEDRTSPRGPWDGSEEQKE